MKVSLVILTFNRRATVERAVTHNLKVAGYPIHEIVWVDNGSEDGVSEFMQSLSPAVSVLHSENRGVAVGYNRGFALASGDWIALTGCDMLMPENWLKTMMEYVEAIPETDVVAMYSVPFSQCTERLRGEMQERNGLRYQIAMPMGRRMMSRAALSKVGYLREDFGLYGWEDVEWAERCLAKGLFCYAIPDQVAEHLGTEGVAMYDGKDPQDYHAFKKAEVADNRKMEVLADCRAKGYPYYNPYD